MYESYQSAPWANGYAAPPAYYGAEGDPSAATPPAETSPGVVATFADKFRGWMAMAHNSDIGAALVSLGVGLFSFFARGGGILESVAWGALTWGGYRLGTALAAGEKLGSEPVFSFALLGAGGGFLLLDRAGMVPSFNLFDDFSEDWG